MDAAKLEDLVHMVLIWEVEAVFLMFLAKMARFGTIIWLIVFALKEPNGMETSVWLVQEEKGGNLSLVVFAQLAHSLLDQDAKESMKPDVPSFLILSGMVFNVFAMKDLMLLDYNVLAMES